MRVKASVTRRLTRLQTMRNVLKYRKIVQNGSLRLRFGCDYFFNLLMFSTLFVFVCVWQLILASIFVLYVLSGLSIFIVYCVCCIFFLNNFISFVFLNNKIHPKHLINTRICDHELYYTR